MRSPYGCSKSRVHILCIYSDTFSVGVGLRQGCPLSQGCGKKRPKLVHRSRMAGIRVRISEIRRELGVEPLPSCQKESGEVVRVSNSEASWTIGGFPGTFNWKETSVKTQDPLDGLYLPAGLGTPPRMSWKTLWVRGKPGSACWVCCHRDPMSD